MAERYIETEKGGKILCYSIEVPREKLGFATNDGASTLSGFGYFVNLLKSNIPHWLPDSELRSALLNPNEAVYDYEFITRPVDKVLTRSLAGFIHASNLNHEETWAEICGPDYRPNPTGHDFKYLLPPTDAQVYSMAIVSVKGQGIISVFEIKWTP